MEKQKLNFKSFSDPLANFELVELIAEGCYAEVHLAKAFDVSNADRVLAVKILDNVAELEDEIAAEYFVLKELSIHPNLPFFQGLYFLETPNPNTSQVWIAMENCDGCSIADFVNWFLKFNSRRLNEKQISYVLHEIVDALLHLHEHNVIHRDVKGQNVILTRAGQVKLIDFGSCAILGSSEEKRTEAIGSPCWMAPEVVRCNHLEGIEYDSRCDVWSLGITAIEIAEGEAPLFDLHPTRALFQIVRNPPPSLNKPHNWSSMINDFIGECLIKNFDQRPYMIELKEHSFLTKVALSSINEVRKSIVDEVELYRKFARVRREPEVFIKNAKLKMNRKSAFQEILVDDLASLPLLNKNSVVTHLQKRFEQKNIYTWAGDILIALNPKTDLEIYTNFYRLKYFGCSVADVPPHIYGMADRVYHSMLHEKKPQVIVATGDLGSGKTFTCNKLLQQLIYLGKAPHRNLETKVVEVNTILEAFGNAFLPDSSNSTRFAKHFNVTFSWTGKLSSVQISTFLLEDTRIIWQKSNEHGFHIFYYLIHGSQLDGSERIQHFKSKYAYLNNYKASASDEAIEKFGSLQKSFKIIGFTDEEMLAINEILIAILHLGEIQFKSSEDGNGCYIHDGIDDLKLVGSALGISAGDLALVLESTLVTNVTKNESFTRRHSISYTKHLKNSFAQFLYRTLFDWIVERTNALLKISETVYGSSATIGIYEAFGFSSTNDCSCNLEQLIVNTTNEMIQFYFNQNIFAWEQEECIVENIGTSQTIKFADNRSVLDLLLGINGVFACITLGSQQKSSKGQSSFKHKLDDNFGSNRYYSKSDGKNDGCFTIRHYAGRVTYDSSKFLDNNRRSMKSDILELLRHSTNQQIRRIFRTVPDLSESDEKFKTKEVHSCLIKLTELLLKARPHFVRCINPNDASDEENFVKAKVSTRLENEGLIDALKLRQIGFSHSFGFGEFLKRYCFLGFNFDERVVADADSCRLLLLRLNMEDWCIGKAKVFLKYYHVEYLSKLYEKQIQKIVFVQSCVRRWLAKIRLQKGMYRIAKKVVSIQKASKIWKQQTKKSLLTASNQKRRKRRSGWLRVHVLGIQESNSLEEKSAEEKAAVVIQTRFRGFIARKKWGPILEERIKQILATHKTKEDVKTALQNEGLDEEEAALIIQRFYRNLKLIKEKSEEIRHDISSSEIPPRWDLSFHTVENKIRKARYGKTSKVSAIDDILGHRQDLIQQGLASQEFRNKQRFTRIQQEWKQVMDVAGSYKTDTISEADEKDASNISCGKSLRASSKQSFVSSEEQRPGSKNPQSTRIPKVKSIDADVTKKGQVAIGDVDYRKLLRKTEMGQKMTHE